MHHEQDMRKMGGLFSKIPFTGTMMWIGSLAIIGFPFFSGYYSKEGILENAYFSSSSIGLYAYTVGIITAFLTAFYSWRLLFMTFHGSARASNDIFNKAHESPIVMTAPLAFLAVGSIFSGFFLSDYFIGSKETDFWFVSIILSHNDHHLPFFQTLIIKSSVAFGVLSAALVYFYRKELANSWAQNLSQL